jgi:F-type H+-transporting ATPase subunit gamma
MKMIKRKIASVKSTKQIMKAMNMVSASKLQKAKAPLKLIRPMYNDLKLIMDSIGSAEGAEDSVYIQKRDVKNAAYLILSSDRGLCGVYNINISKEALSHMSANPDVQEKIIVVGAKGYDFFRRRNKNIAQRYIGISESAFYEESQKIASQLVSMYLSGEVDEVYIAYTHFETILSHEPCVVKILPISADDNAPSGRRSSMTYDPDINAFMAHAVPMYLNILVYGSMVESNACEQASRMTSMDSATRNATEIIDDLTLVYNSKRQGAITQEIIEIISGANTLQ